MQMIRSVGVENSQQNKTDVRIGAKSPENEFDAFFDIRFGNVAP